MFERHKIKKSLQPSREFAAKTKGAFLAVFDAAHPESPAIGGDRPHGFTALAKSLVALSAVVAIFVSVSVYADTANVSANSPLYPLKRLSENVQLAVAPMSEKAQLQATFAARRADEITQLAAAHPTSTILLDLQSDLNSDVDGSLSDARSANLGDGQLSALCNKVFGALATSSIDIHGGFGKGSDDERVRTIGKFLDQCGGAVGAQATGTVRIMPLMPAHEHGEDSSTTVATSSIIQENIRDRNDEHEQASSPAESSTESSTIMASTSIEVHLRGGDEGNILGRWHQLLNSHDGQDD